MTEIAFFKPILGADSPFIGEIHRSKDRKHHQPTSFVGCLEGGGVNMADTRFARLYHHLSVEPSVGRREADTIQSIA